MSVVERNRNSNFYGLTKQIGPWRSTPADKYRQASGSTGDDVYTMHPYVVDARKPSPKMSKWAQRTVVTKPYDVNMRKPVPGYQFKQLPTIGLINALKGIGTRGGPSGIDQGTQSSGNGDGDLPRGPASQTPGNTIGQAPAERDLGSEGGTAVNPIVNYGAPRSQPDVEVFHNYLYDESSSPSTASFKTAKGASSESGSYLTGISSAGSLNAELLERFKKLLPQSEEFSTAQLLARLNAIRAPFENAALPTLSASTDSSMKEKLFNLKTPKAPSSASTDKGMQEQLNQLRTGRSNSAPELFERMDIDSPEIINPPAVQQGNFALSEDEVVQRFLAYQGAYDRGEVDIMSPLDTPRGSVESLYHMPPPPGGPRKPEYIPKTVDYAKIARERNPYGLQINTDDSSTSRSPTSRSSSNLSKASYNPQTEAAVNYKPGAAKNRRKKKPEKLVI